MERIPNSPTFLGEICVLRTWVKVTIYQETGGKEKWRDNWPESGNQLARKSVDHLNWSLSDYRLCGPVIFMFMSVLSLLGKVWRRWVTALILGQEYEKHAKN